MREPAHRAFVRRFLDWDRVVDRLERYPCIAAHFPIEDLRAASGTIPYHCHWLAWRLGTWTSEEPFAHLEELLAFGSRLPGWNHERRNLASPEFNHYWGVVWQLQIAMLIGGLEGNSVAWLKEGPDLAVERRPGRGCFVECYTYRKSFDRREFAEDLFRLIDPRIEVEHASWASAQLPSGPGLENFFDDLFRPYLDEGFLKSKHEEAERSYPVPLPVPPVAKNLTVHLKGGDPKKYVPGRVPTVGGDPEVYLKVALSEAVHAKADSNSLAESRPNLLAINFALSRDFQVATALRSGRFRETLSALEFPGSIDAVVLGACGIDALPDHREMRFRAKKSGHPAGPLFPGR